MNVPMLLAEDFYKYGHPFQYDKDITKIWSNWTPRSNYRTGEPEGIIHLGPQLFIKEYLIRKFGETFFSLPWAQVEAEYKEYISTGLGIIDPPTEHIRKLHAYGRFPLDIYTLPEGSQVPYRIPTTVITNTQDWAYWVPNFIETLFSLTSWKITTSATTARRFRMIMENAGKEAGEKDLNYVEYQGHDFSMRGMSGLEDAILSGIGHLVFFSGTDTVPAIWGARTFYNAGKTVGGSVNATEHSVVMAGGSTHEFETFKRLITEVYPTGRLSLVSDTWNLWRVLTDFIPRLKPEILARDLPIIIRPDSGDPVKIVLGDPTSSDPFERRGATGLLADALGLVDNPTGKLPLINNGRIIYGDAISEIRAQQILEGLTAQGLSPANQALGIGSYTYEYVTRDTDGWALKATGAARKNIVYPLFKDPITDSGSKKSIRGFPWVEYGPTGVLQMVESPNPDVLDRGAYRKVLVDGFLVHETDFDTIRKNARKTL